MLMEGVASARDIDKALKLGLNHPMGPFELVDLVGLDTRLAILKFLHRTLGEKFRPCPLLEQYVAAGRLGRKSGRGFYFYKGGKKRGVDDNVYELLGAHPNGGPRPADILQRLVLGMVNEAARALGEGVVRSPRDGDIGAIFGFGFPPFRGGPLRYADDLGAERVVSDLERLAERHGARFAPSDVLREQAGRGAKFYG